MSKLGYFPLLFLGLLIGCQQNSDRIPTNSSISVAIETQNNIIIKPLSPQPIRINLEDLPPPFHSESASKPPQVIPIPNNPVLNVPPDLKLISLPKI